MSYTFKTQFNLYKYLQKSERDDRYLDFTYNQIKLLLDTVFTTFGVVRRRNYKIGVVTPSRYYVAVMIVNKKTQMLDEIKLLETGKIDPNFDINKIASNTFLIVLGEILGENGYPNIEYHNSTFNEIFNNRLRDAGVELSIDDLCCIMLVDILVIIDKFTDVYKSLLSFCSDLVNDFKIGLAVYNVRNGEMVVDLIDNNED